MTEKTKPKVIDLGDGTFKYECPNCEHETDEHCQTFSEACYYCPEECHVCGRGYCDQSC